MKEGDKRGRRDGWPRPRRVAILSAAGLLPGPSPRARPLHQPETGTEHGHGDTGGPALEILQLVSAPPLEGPGRAGVRRASGSESLVISGGGIAAVVSASRGLAGIWQGAVPYTVPIFRMDGVPLPTAVTLEGGAGCWYREMPFKGLGILEERGLLQDILAAPVVQWIWRPSGHTPEEVNVSADRSPTLKVAPPAPRHDGLADGRRLSGDVPAFVLTANTPVTLALVPDPMDSREEERIRSILAPLPARERQRGDHRSDTDALEITVTAESGDAFSPLETALLACEDAAVGHPPGSGPAAPFVAGSTRQAPGFLEGAHLAEFALAALLAGRPQIAGAAIAALAAEESAPPFAFVHVAAEWAMWTGQMSVLLGLRDPLGRAIRRIVSAPPDPPPPAAWPPSEQLLERLAVALEPAGVEDWVAELQSFRKAMDKGRGMRLPVLVGPTGPSDGSWTPPGAVRTPPVVPPPESFPDELLGPARPKDTVLAARLIRSWVEGVIGVRPDAVYGRLRLGPELRPEWRRLRVRGITQGTVRVSIDCLREGSEFAFRLQQDSGRVPVNLIFEPLLPVQSVEGVRMGNEDADVTLLREPGGIRLRCQFPLDPERRLTVVTSA